MEAVLLRPRPEGGLIVEPAEDIAETLVGSGAELRLGEWQLRTGGELLEERAVMVAVASRRS